jgi:proteasome alpha subunit
VSARGLANAYAQTLGTVFTQESKPYEVEIVVAEVGQTPDRDQIYRLTYDGSVADEHGFVVMGGAAELIEDRPQGGLEPGLHPRAGRGAAPGRRPAGHATRPGEQLVS